MNLCKKIFTLLTIFLLFVRVASPVFVFAQEVTPTDTPAPTVDQATVNNSASDTNGTNSSANTGNNTTTVDTPTPTTDPNATVTPTVTPTLSTDTPTPTVDPNATPSADPSVDPSATGSADISASNSADVNNGVGSSSNTGSNSTTSSGNNNSSSDPSSTPTPTPTPQITVQTGDAVSVVAGDNTINTTSINSNVTNQTINVYGDETGDIDLSTLFQLVSNIVTNDKNNSPVINVQVTGVNNYAYLSNTVTSSANTGGNITSGSGDVVVNTGSADSVVSLINKVNLTVVNSSLHLVTINIFGHLSGNIILPTLTPLQSTSCTSCGVSFNANNQATVNNTVTSNANTGQNTTTASGDAALTTGNAESEVNVANIVNTNILGAIFENLFINEFGYWNGSFLGWDNFGPSAAGSLALSSTGLTGNSGPTNTISDTNINNTAYVNNNISSLANTGGNYTNGKNVNVHTGDAYSAVSLINFINSNFFNSFGFFGFINIFGGWDGSIGGVDKFITPTPDVVSSNIPADDTGALSVENTNNVGAYVLPGDTVTFFLKVKDIGSGKVLGTKLNLFLIHNGQNVGGTTINLGDLNGGRGFKVSTGLVLSKTTPPGDYIARAVVTGTTEQTGTQVSATADSTFTVFGNTATTLIAGISNTKNTTSHKHILGVHTNSSNRNDWIWYLALGGVIAGYVTIRVVRNRQEFMALFSKDKSVKEKLTSFRLFLV